MLNRGNHRNRLLQEDYDIHGLDNFLFTVLEVVDDDIRYDQEQKWMNEYRDQGLLYNILPLAGKATGRVHFEETKRKLSQTMKGRRPSLVTLRASADARRGKPMPEETRRKMSEAHRRRDSRGSNSTSAKLSESKVSAILRRLSSGELQKDLAREYGVAKGTISKIWIGETWTNVPREAATV